MASNKQNKNQIGNKLYTFHYDGENILLEENNKHIDRVLHTNIKFFRNCTAFRHVLFITLFHFTQLTIHIVSDNYSFPFYSINYPYSFRQSRRDVFGC